MFFYLKRYQLRKHDIKVQCVFNLFENELTCYKYNPLIYNPMITVSIIIFNVMAKLSFKSNLLPYFYIITKQKVVFNYLDNNIQGIQYHFSYVIL